MPTPQLASVLAAFERTIAECRHLADDARAWSLPAAARRIPRARRDSMIELAFLRGFLAWETLLEESFVLYMLGKRPPRGRAPFRFVLPPNRRAAHAMAAGGREYAKWDSGQEVVTRAERFFRDGRPYAPVLRSEQQLLQDVKVVRNAVAHDSTSSRNRFEVLVRRELTVLPPRLTIGGFLDMTKPGSASPLSFLEHYLEQLGILAGRIVHP